MLQWDSPPLEIRGTHVVIMNKILRNCRVMFLFYLVQNEAKLALYMFSVVNEVPEQLIHDIG